MEMLIVLQLISLLCLSVSADVFSSSADITNLLKSEKLAIDTIFDYIKDEEGRLDSLKKIAQKEQEKVAEQDLSNPVTVYLTIKRILNSDVFKMLKKNPAEEHLTPLYKVLPQESDLNGAVVALLRLQQMYNLNTEDMARGVIPGVKDRRPLNTGDCYHIARVAYEAGDHHHAVLWFLQVWERQNEGNSTSKYDKSTVLDYLSFALYQQGNLQRAWWMTKVLVELDPKNERAVNNIDRYAEEIIEKGLKVPKSESDLPEIINPVNTPKGFLQQMNYPLYEPLCRGEMLTNRTGESYLLCTLKRDTPMSSIRPYKVEQVLHDPDIWIFHDLIGNGESNRIVEISSPMLSRALVKDRTSTITKDVPASYRVAKSAWMAESVDPLVATINARLADVSDLSMETSELLQIANYGMGGQYEPHFDMATKNLNKPYREDNGNRIATALVYLTTPWAGGATIFESLKVHVPAVKGNVVFWYNLKRSGDPDLRMKHAGCPVVSGIKWVANKWIRSHGQMFRRPCVRHRGV